MSSGTPPWSEREFDEMRRCARQRFVERYEAEVRPAYSTVVDHCTEVLEMLFEATDCLVTLKRHSDLLEGEPELLDAARYTTSPVVSEDVLRVLVADRGEFASKLFDYLDRRRFAWLNSGRTPNFGDAEVDQAILATATLWASQRHATETRNTISRNQEARVKEALECAGQKFVEREAVRDRIAHMNENTALGFTPKTLRALHPGEFTAEMEVVGAKADFPVRLPDGKLFPIECKVSNTAVNSVKRLNRETVGKHRAWMRAFAGEILAGGAVLGGVFGLVNLISAQDDGVIIFFDHDLGALERFVKARK